MRILKLDINKMRRHREKHLPHFRIERVDRKALEEIPELMDFLRLELFKMFVEEMRIRRVWNPKQVEYIMFTDFDIDYNNQQRVGISERFLPEVREV